MDLGRPRWSQTNPGPKRAENGLRSPETVPNRSGVEIGGGAGVLWPCLRKESTTRRRVGCLFAVHRPFFTRIWPLVVKLAKHWALFGPLGVRDHEMARIAIPGPLPPCASPPPGGFHPIVSVLAWVVLDRCLCPCRPAQNHDVGHSDSSMPGLGPLPPSQASGSGVAEEECGDRLGCNSSSGDDYGQGPSNLSPGAPPLPKLP